MAEYELDVNSKDIVIRLASRAIKNYKIKYDPGTHIPLLITVFKDGGEICHFCKEAEIGRQTFYAWKKEYKEFEAAFNVAKEMAHAHWLNLLPKNLIEEDGSKFNVNAWKIIMRNRFGITEQRKVNLPKLKSCNTPQDQMKCIIDYIAVGELTPHESNQLSSIIVASLKVEENTSIKERLQKAEELLADKG